MKKFTIQPCAIVIPRNGPGRPESFQWIVKERGRIVAAFISENAGNAYTHRLNQIQAKL